MKTQEADYMNLEALGIHTYKPQHLKKKKVNKLRVFLFFLITFLLIISLAGNVYCIYKIREMQAGYEKIEQTVAASNEANQQVLAILKEVRNTQQKQDSMLQKTVARKQTINILKTIGFSPDMDLGKYTNLSVSDMDKIIDYYNSKVGGGSEFKGKGYVFIEASKQSGLNPIYIFAHASLESGYGKSHLARTRHNYFGINAVDSNPGAAYTMGNSVDQGIINGAIWIKKNFYDQGFRTLDEMSAAGYASDKNWPIKISNIADTAIQVI